MNKFLLISLTFLTACCNGTHASESNFGAEYIFSMDGCKVYRFRDDYHYHYFTNCTQTISEITSGKTTVSENINTSHKE